MATMRTHRELFALLYTKYHTPNSGGILWSFDPGETTGVACFDYTIENEDSYVEPKLLYAVGISTPSAEDTLTFVSHTINTVYPNHSNQEIINQSTFIIESYLVYPWAVKEHTWSSIHTAQMIGGLKAYAGHHNIPLHMQSASKGKSFWHKQRTKKFINEVLTTQNNTNTNTNTKQHKTTQIQNNNPHAIDAVSHGLHFLTSKGDTIGNRRNRQHQSSAALHFTPTNTDDPPTDTQPTA